MHGFTGPCEDSISGNLGVVGNARVVIGAHSVAVIDTDGSPGFVQRLRAGVAALTDWSAARVITTHTQRDHAFGGAGRFRHGLGTRRTWRVLERDTRATVCCERTKSAPFGIAGGAAGATARISVVEQDGTERVVNSKGSFDAPAGSLVVFDVPGSGGYGPPAERDPARLRQDLRDGYVTPAGAKRDYGVELP